MYNAGHGKCTYKQQLCCQPSTDSLFLLLIPAETDESKSHPGRSTGWVATRVLDSAALAALAEIGE